MPNLPYVALHPQPVGSRRQAGAAVYVHVGPNNGENEWEQLWGQRRARTRVVIACIPFFATHIRLGDEVEIDNNRIFQRVLRHSRQSTFRVWFDAAAEQQKLASRLTALNVKWETCADGFLALSVREGADARALTRLLQTAAKGGALHYTAHRRW